MADPKSETAGDQIPQGHGFVAPPGSRREIERTQTAPQEVRFDIGGPIGAMATVDNYVMCRRPGRVPFVLTLVDWHRLPLSADLVAAAASPRATVQGVRI